MQIKLHTPIEVLKPLAQTLEGYGAVVDFETPSSGLITHPSGLMRFEHDGRCLMVEIMSHAGHFPIKLLIGGIRQLIEEAVEIHNKKAKGA